MEEVWKDVRGYEGQYQVSNLGRVRSLDRYVRHNVGTGYRLRKGKIKTLSAGPANYLVTNIGSIGPQLVHRLVLEAFVGPCPPKHVARHYPDPSGSNNRLDNLSWATNSQNQIDRVEHGTSNRGERCGTSKLSTEDVIAIKRELLLGMAQADIALKYGIDQSSVSDIRRGVTWKHLQEETKHDRIPDDA